MGSIFRLHTYLWGPADSYGDLSFVNPISHLGGSGCRIQWNVPIEIAGHSCVCVVGYLLLLSSRYPVILEHFSLRTGSGGAGRHRGGDGVIRKLLFRNKVVLSVLTERRATRPYGLMGKISLIMNYFLFKAGRMMMARFFSLSLMVRRRGRSSRAEPAPQG